MSSSCASARGDSSILDRLDKLEALLWDVHWCFVGQWQPTDPTDNVIQLGPLSFGEPYSNSVYVEAVPRKIVPGLPDQLAGQQQSILKTESRSRRRRGRDARIKKEMWSSLNRQELPRHHSESSSERETTHAVATGVSQLRDAGSEGCEHSSYLVPTRSDEAANFTLHHVAWEPLPFIAKRDLPSLQAVSRSHADLFMTKIEQDARPTDCEVSDQVDPGTTSLTPNSIATAAAVPSKVPAQSRRFPIRVEYSVTDELAADDICEHFEKFGPVCDIDFVEDVKTGVEVARLFFADPSSRVEAMKQARQRIVRSEDRKPISAKIYVQFSDNSL